MAKKKNCRMTDEERAVHDRAVSLRKMTDQQLCETMDRQHSKGIRNVASDSCLIAQRDIQAQVQVVVNS